MQWKVGRVKITKLVEMETVGSTRFILPAATNDEIRKLPWLIPHFATEEGRLKMSIHSLVLETPSRRIVGARLSMMLKEYDSVNGNPVVGIESGIVDAGR